MTAVPPSPLAMVRKAGYDQCWKYRLEIDNRYSLLFRLRMQKFFTFFLLSIGAYPFFLRSKSILINRYFFSE